MEVQREEEEEELLDSNTSSASSFHKRQRAEETKMMIRFTPLDLIKNEFHISEMQMAVIANRMVLEMEKGLSEQSSSTLKMIPSFVTQIPNGTEKGLYYALDLGGTNLRVSRFLLNDNGQITKTHEHHHKIPKEAINGTAKQLFGSIAQAILHVAEASKDTNVCLGFTFSFPFAQTSITEGKLIAWTKGFSTSGVVGEDLVSLLKQSLQELSKTISVDIVAVLNDTVGTLAARSYTDPTCRIGVILGTGTNAAYVEETRNIRKLKIDEGDYMIINMEWGGFGSKPDSQMLPRTQIDVDLDKSSTNPGEQFLEKMISGYYLGELARLILLELVRHGEIFQDCGKIDASHHLYQAGSFDAKTMSDIEVDESAELLDIEAKVRESLGIQNCSYLDRKLVKLVCEIVVERAARLTAAALMAVCLKLGSSANNIGIDGSVYENHTSFRHRMERALKSLNFQGSIGSAKDGSGLGAALIAASISSTKRKQNKKI